MKKNWLFILAFSLSILAAKAQDPATRIKNNAIKIDRPETLNRQVYSALSGYRVIMAGEMHGTNEPAKLITGLARLMTGMGDSVMVGMEIPVGQMTQYLNNPADSTVSSSDFFTQASTDGRASHAWAEVISSLTGNPAVRIFFFDVNSGECKNPADRDSLMYLKIREKIAEHPSWKTITLSGNIHNMLMPYNGKNKVACYLNNDPELSLKGMICSLNHYYQKGGMLNNTGSGLALHEVNNPPSEYTDAVDYDNYLLLFPAGTADRYSGIFFTRTVTAARMVNSH